MNANLGILLILILASFTGCESPAEARKQTYSQQDEVEFNRVLRDAERGDPVAQFNTGVSYATGAGIPIDQEKALIWWHRAAERGHDLAQYNLGFYYATGQGLTMDPVKAVFWYKKSAEQGDVKAQHALGLCYFNGEGVPKDEIEAYAYFNLAGIIVPESRFNLNLMEKKMSPDARLLGQRRTKELQKEIEGKIAVKKVGN
jgi:hypothetical protein